MPIRTVPAIPEVLAAGSAELFEKTLAVRTCPAVALAVVLVGRGAPVEGADNQGATTEGAADLLMATTEPSGQACGHAARPVVDLSPQLLAHGEDHALGSVIVLGHQFPCSPGHLFSSVVFHVHCLLCLFLPGQGGCTVVLP